MPRGDKPARQWRRLQFLGRPDGLPVEDAPYLVFGQWTHPGSGTTFGLGGYRVEP